MGESKSDFSVIRALSIDKTLVQCRIRLKRSAIKKVG